MSLAPVYVIMQFWAIVVIIIITNVIVRMELNRQHHSIAINCVFIIDASVVPYRPLTHYRSSPFRPAWLIQIIIITIACIAAVRFALRWPLAVRCWVVKHITRSCALPLAVVVTAAVLQTDHSSFLGFVVQTLLLLPSPLLWWALLSSLLARFLDQHNNNIYNGVAGFTPGNSYGSAADAAAAAASYLHNY